MHCKLHKDTENFKTAKQQWFLDFKKLHVKVYFEKKTKHFSSVHSISTKELVCAVG